MRLPGRNISLNGGLVNGTISMGISYINNRLICKYRRTLTVPAGSEQYMRSLETLTFPVWGNSDNIAPNGQPGRHMGPGSGERLAEEMQSNLRFVVIFFTFYIYKYKTLHPPGYRRNDTFLTLAVGHALRTSFAQVHKLPQCHCGDNLEGTLFL